MNDYYSTTDIYLAATLSSIGYNIEDIKKDGSKFIFIVGKTSESPPWSIETDVENYWKNNIIADPKKVFSEFKSIKARMYDLKRSAL